MADKAADSTANKANDRLQRELTDLVEPLAEGMDVEVVDVLVRGTGPRQLVRVLVDRKGGVDLATCQRLSQSLSSRLDEEDLIPGRYALEVSSPGVDHPLRDRRAFDRVEGRAVLVHRRDEEGRLTQVRGTVVEAAADDVVLAVDGAEVRIPYTAVAKATQTLPW